MVAIGQGAQASITSSIQAAGSEPAAGHAGLRRELRGGVRTQRGTGSPALTMEDAAAITRTSRASRPPSRERSGRLAGRRRRQQHQHARSSASTPAYATVKHAHDRRAAASSPSRTTSRCRACRVLGATDARRPVRRGRATRRAAGAHQRHRVPRHRRDRGEGRQRLRQRGRRGLHPAHDRAAPAHRQRRTCPTITSRSPTAERHDRGAAAQSRTLLLDAARHHGLRRRRTSRCMSQADILVDGVDDHGHVHRAARLDRRHLAARRRHRHHEHDAHDRDRADARDRPAQGDRRDARATSPRSSSPSR